MNKLNKDVLEIRRSFVEMKTGENDPDKNFIRDVLIGNCVENADHLSEKLSERGYSTNVVKGGLNLPREPTPDTYKEAKQIGSVHHWVEVRSDGKLVFANMIREGEVTCNPLVSESVPDSYIRF